MGKSAEHSSRPHYFLLRPFLADLDLLVILNTKRCRYRCKFCNLPAKSSAIEISAEQIAEQFLYVCREIKHALSVIDRITLSNDGSVLDADTLPLSALETIVRCSSRIRSARRLVLESRLEFASSDLIRHLQEIARHLSLDILTGFETRDEQIREKFLAKRETIEQFERGLDQIARTRVSLTAYVLLKPSPSMTDEAAVQEANRSITYLHEQTECRGIPLTVRLNPMYAARGTPWAAMATKDGRFAPPRLTDVLTVAQGARDRGIRIYIGLSTEGLAFSGGTYMAREDFSRNLLRQAKRFNRAGADDLPPG
jgi:hypothetical protein